MSPLEQLTRRVLAELTAAYGARFARQYEGADQELVRRAWGRQLHGLSHESIGWALRHLPEHPPNAMAFRSIALQRPTEYRPALPEPHAPPDKARLESLLAKARAPSHRHPRQWAYDLRDRERNGERLTLAQRQMWRAAVPEEDQQHPAKPHVS
jgi:hypothetical protein